LLRVVTRHQCVDGLRAETHRTPARSGRWCTQAPEAERALRRVGTGSNFLAGHLAMDRVGNGAGDKESAPSRELQSMWYDPIQQKTGSSAARPAHRDGSSHAYETCGRTTALAGYRSIGPHSVTATEPRSQSIHAMAKPSIRRTQLTGPDSCRCRLWADTGGVGRHEVEETRQGPETLMRAERAVRVRQQLNKFVPMFAGTGVDTFRPGTLTTPATATGC